MGSDFLERDIQAAVALAASGQDVLSRLQTDSSVTLVITRTGRQDRKPDDEPVIQLNIYTAKDLDLYIDSHYGLTELDWIDSDTRTMILNWTNAVLLRGYEELLATRLWRPIKLALRLNSKSPVLWTRSPIVRASSSNKRWVSVPPRPPQATARQREEKRVKRACEETPAGFLPAQASVSVGAMPRFESINILAEGGPGTRSYAAACQLSVAADVLSRHFEEIGGVESPVRMLELLLHDDPRFKRTEYGRRTNESDSIYLFTKGSFAQGPGPSRMAILMSFLWIELLNREKEYGWDSSVLRDAEEALVSSNYVTHRHEMHTTDAGTNHTLAVEGEFLADISAVRRISVSTFKGSELTRRFVGSFTGVYTSSDFRRDFRSGALDPPAEATEIWLPGESGVRLVRGEVADRSPSAVLDSQKEQVDSPVSVLIADSSSYRTNANFKASAPLDGADFWESVEDVWGDSQVLDDLVIDRLIHHLSRRSDRDIASFAREFHLAHRRVYRSDQWAAGFLLQGGISDDGFTDFRTWLIAHGRTFYERVVADPDSCLSEVPHLVMPSEWGVAETYSSEIAREYESRFGELPEELLVDFIGIEPSGGLPGASQLIPRLVQRIAP